MGQQQATATPLVDARWQSHLKFKGREPRTLEEVTIARADYEHRARLGTIKKLSAKLALLHTFLDPLRAAGVDLAKREFDTLDSGKSLRIRSVLFSAEDQLHVELLKLGFRELERKDWGSSDLVRLKYGRSLVVEINVTKAQPVAAATEAQQVPA
ncbi:hypothetical protein [Aquincola tertiaricarbonis]|uniref:hypothetical protein n=1 Tax=Aquincola tertiaricarbonis TaxID=391953 RepID=UPI0012ECE888|nr:hypothetical protein [Aquincola tertiaricarbonis]